MLVRCFFIIVNQIVLYLVCLKGYDVTNLRGVGEDLDIRDGEDANAGIPLPLIPVVVHLLLDVDYVSLAETELTTVLRLETEQGLGDHLAIGGLLSSVQENC